jgi:hypothetical protein
MTIAHIFSDRRLAEYNPANPTHFKKPLVGLRFDAITLHCTPDDLMDAHFMEWFSQSVWLRRTRPNIPFYIEVSQS